MGVNKLKETYIKPQLHIEYFALSQSIANCGAAHDSSLGVPTHWSKTDCAWKVGDALYWSSVPACGESEDDVYPEGWEDLKGVCYNNPNGGATIFSS